MLRFVIKAIIYDFINDLVLIPCFSAIEVLSVVFLKHFWKFRILCNSPPYFQILKIHGLLTHCLFKKTLLVRSLRDFEIISKEEIFKETMLMKYVEKNVTLKPRQKISGEGLMNDRNSRIS